jgi:hypothetical protein
MAKQLNQPDSATSQWFVNLSDNSANLDNASGGFTVFGRVLDDGLDIANTIATTASSTIPSSPHPLLFTIYDKDNTLLQSIVPSTPLQAALLFPDDTGCFDPDDMGMLLIEDPQTAADLEPHPAYGLPFYLVSPACEGDPPPAASPLVIDCDEQAGRRVVLVDNSAQLPPRSTPVSEEAPLGVMEATMSCDDIAASDASYARHLGASTIQFEGELVYTTYRLPEPHSALLHTTALLALLSLRRARPRRGQARAVR